MPAHRHPQDGQKNDQHSSQQGSGLTQKNREEIINVDMRAMAHVPQTVCETDEQASQAVPVKTGCTSPKIERDGLVKYVSMTEAKQTLVLRANADATMCFGHIQDQCGKSLIGRTERQASANMGQGGIRRLVGEAGVGGDPADRTVYQNVADGRGKPQRLVFPRQCAGTADGAQHHLPEPDGSSPLGFRWPEGRPPVQNDLKRISMKSHSAEVA